MHFQIWLLPALLASTFATPSPVPSPTPQYSSPQPPRSGYYPPSSQRPVYTAQRARDTAPEEDEPYPSTASLGTAQTSNGAEEPENTGFVDPIDFKNILRDVGASSKELGGNSPRNPLYASESKNSYAGFFGTNKDPFTDFGGGNLATASSDRNPKGTENEDSTGFVDPNVQFRSLFDSSQTASSGFKPEDFLGGQGESSGAEPSKTQTRSFPSYTYTGRKDDEGPRYRSNYREIESQDDDYNDNYRGRDDREDSPRSYSNNDRDRGYYRDNGPPARGGPPPPRYNNNNQGGPRYTPATQATSHRPQSTGRGGGPKASASSNSNNPKCKKVEKTVDYQNEDYASFTEPEPDYDPSTYRGRYKRQSRQGRQSSRGGSKRPMTCYVCEDEHGRYAERCSYDSKADPKKGEYFHSSSSAFSDNGRRPSGKTNRNKRTPSSNRRSSKDYETSATTSASVSILAPSDNASNKRNAEIEESEPAKVIEKRQTGPNRYASGFGGNNNRNGQRDQGGRGGNTGGDDPFYEYNPNFGTNGDYGLPRGINRGRGIDREFDNPQARAEAEGFEGTGTGGRGRSSGNDYGFTGGRSNNRNNDNDFQGFGPEPNFNDFNFGPTGGSGGDFGAESSSPSSNSGGGGRGRDGSGEGFNYDFSIPREFDPDAQNSNTNRPNLDGSASNNANTFPTFDDAGYDDYVKQYFPETFGREGGDRDRDGPSSSEAPARHLTSSSNSFTPNSGPPINYHHNPQSTYRSRDGPPPGPPRQNSFNQYHHGPPPPQNGHHHHGSPDKEHTQPSYNFAPPPHFFENSDSPPIGQDHGHGPDHVEENVQGLGKLMQNFDGKDRNGCQKVQKGDMTCYVCRDARGMNKEECMYASGDPKNQRMAYHEVTEYSSDPPASILPVPKPQEGPQTAANSNGQQHTSASAISQKTVASPKSAETKPKPSSNHKSITRVESRVISTKIHHEKKSPSVDYDFDY